MRSFWILLLLVGSLTLDSLPVARAGGRGIEGYGPVVGLSLGPDQLLLGGFVDFGAVTTPIHVLGFADIGFGDDFTTVAVGPSFVSLIPIEGLGHFYGGIFLGFNYNRLSDSIVGTNLSVTSTDLAVAADLGMLYPMEDNSVLLDLKINLSSHSDLKLLVGYQIDLD